MTKSNRIPYTYEGRVIYEWEQSLDEVTLYLSPPHGVTAKHLHVEITPHHLVIGLKGSDSPFIDEDTGGSVKVSESYWQLEDGELTIGLQKMLKAELWSCALKGRNEAAAQPLTPLAQEEAKKRLLLERFQEEVCTSCITVTRITYLHYSSIQASIFLVPSLMVMFLTLESLWEE